MNVSTLTDRPRILAPDGTFALAKALKNNWYEASRWSPLRSWVWYPVQDAKKDLDRFTRYELSKHARYLYKNSPFIRGLIERFVTLTIGRGFFPKFKSRSNPAWAAKMNLKWRARSKNVNLGYKASFPTYQRAVGRVRFIDGEGFTIKTFDEESMENRIQAVESDRCQGDTSQSYNGDRPLNVDGVILNRQGVPTDYKFTGVEAPYDAQDIVHHYTPMRPEQYRGETILAAAINTARDVDDILALEKDAVKDASARKDVIKTPTGELNPEQFRSLRYGSDTTNGQYPTLFALPGDPKAKNDYYKLHFSGEPVVLQTGDEYTPYEPKRPGSAWTGFMDFLANTICLSTNIPPTVVLPISMGGTDIRRDNDIAQMVVEPWQDDMIAESEDLVLYLMQDEMAEGNPPDDWYISWTTTRKINVDRAQAMQDRLDVQAGLMSREKYHGQFGDDSEVEDDAVIEEAVKRRDRIKGAGFKDVDEFVKVLSLDPKLFMSKGGGAPGEPPKPTEE